MIEQYKLERSNDMPGWWVLTDTKYLIVLKFKEGDFNDSQKVTPLNEDIVELGAQKLAEIMRMMGDYIVRYHGDIAFSRTYGIMYDEDDDHLCIYRNKYPKWKLKLEDKEVDRYQMAKSLKKAAEFLIKGINND